MEFEYVDDDFRVGEAKVDEVLDWSDVEEGDVEEEFAAGDKTVTGEFQIGSQYHFHLETQTCIVKPEEDGLTVSSSTQVRHLAT